MTLTIDITPRLEAQLATQADAHGMQVDAYAASLLAHAGLLPSASLNHPDSAGDPRRDAIERLRTFGKTQGLSLGGITLRQLRHETRP